MGGSGALRCVPSRRATRCRAWRQLNGRAVHNAWLFPLVFERCLVVFDVLLKHGARRTVHGARCMGHGASSMVHGAQQAVRGMHCPRPDPKPHHHATCYAPARGQRNASDGTTPSCPRNRTARALALPQAPPTTCQTRPGADPSGSVLRIAPVAHRVAVAWHDMTPGSNVKQQTTRHHRAVQRVKRPRKLPTTGNPYHGTKRQHGVGEEVGCNTQGVWGARRWWSDF